MNDQTSMPRSALLATRKALLKSGLSLYRHVLSPILHSTQRTLTGTTGACRFQPTCSEYAAIAIQMHGLRLGSRIALLRLLRCHPFSRGGFDPVPDSLSGSDAPQPGDKDRAALRHAEPASHLP